MNKKPLIIANWKCNPLTRKQAEHLFKVINSGIKSTKDVEVVICPPYVYLSGFKLQALNFILGAQDCLWEQKGAFTGEVSPLMLKDLGCQYVIVGHSERRKYFGETDQIINRKIKAALKARLKPILCLGEETRDTFDSDGRPASEMNLIVQEQMERALANISSNRLSEVVIVYEPVWAISTNNGVSCSPDEALQAELFIKKILSKLYNRRLAEGARILYGGSVTAKNSSDYIKKAGMNGLLIGGASLNASEFVRIVKGVYEISPRF